MLDDSNHPLWRALAVMLLPHLDEKEGESFTDAIARIASELETPAKEALQMARALLLMQPISEVLSGERNAKKGESLDETLLRVLVEEGESSYGAARVAGGHDESVQSAGLPQAEVRAARRLAARARQEAVKRHEELSSIVIPHKPVIVGRPLENMKDGLLAALDRVVRAAEKREAMIVKNIDGQRRKSGRGRRG